MRKIFLGLVMAAGMTASAAGAATLNFVAEANNNGERGIADNTTLTIGGLAVKFNTDGYHAYFDSSSAAEVARGGAGLGVCKVLSGTQCNPSSDDNLTMGEHVTLSFLTNQTISGLKFNQEGHFAFAANSTRKLQYALNGGSLISATFGSMISSTFLNVRSITFAYGRGGKARQYYVGGMTAVASVPVPAAAPLLLGALGLLGFGATRRRKTQG